MKITPRFIIVSLINLLVFSVPFYFQFVNEELFEFNKMILTYAFTVLIAFFWIARMIIEKQVIFKRTPLDFPILLFLLSQLVSTLFSIHPYTSLFGYYSRFNGGLLSTLAYSTIFYAFVSNVKKKDLGGFFLSLFVSGLFVSIYGILEHFGFSLSCLLVPGQRTIGVDCWVQDVQSRVFASFGQPNWLAAYVITLLPLSLIAAVQKKLSVYKRALFLATTAAFFIVLIYTRSRSGMLGLAGGLTVSALLIALVQLKNKSSIIKQLHLPSVAGAITGLVALALVLGTPFTPSLSQLVQQSQTTESQTENSQLEPETQQANPEPTPNIDRLQEGGTDSGEIRKIVWTGAIKVWQRYPIIGSGVETFAYSYYQDRIREHNDVSEWDFLYNKAHNELLNILATTGAVGLLTYLFIFGVFSFLTLQILTDTDRSSMEKLISAALAGGLSALFISNFFGFSTVTVNVLQYCFFAVTVLFYLDKKIHKINKKDKKRTQSGINDAWQYFALTLASITALVLLFRIYNYWAADKAYAQGKAYFNAGQLQYGVQQQLEAITRSPKEALFYDTLSDDYAKLAVHLATIGEATAAGQIAQETVAISDQALLLNNRHINFYKTRARVFVTLSQLDEAYLDDARATLLQAIELAPTDPKLVYTLAVIEHTSGNLETSLELYQKALLLKPNYERALWKLSEVYEALGNYTEAIKPIEYILENVSPNNPEAIARIELLTQKQQQDE